MKPFTPPSPIIVGCPHWAAHTLFNLAAEVPTSVVALAPPTPMISGMCGYRNHYSPALYISTPSIENNKWCLVGLFLLSFCSYCIVLVFTAIELLLVAYHISAPPHRHFKAQCQAVNNICWEPDSNVPELLRRLGEDDDDGNDEDGNDGRHHRSHCVCECARVCVCVCVCVREAKGSDCQALPKWDVKPRKSRRCHLLHLLHLPS